MPSSGKYSLRKSTLFVVLIWALKQPLTTWTIAMHITSSVRSPARWHLRNTDTGILMLCRWWASWPTSSTRVRTSRRPGSGWSSPGMWTLPRKRSGSHCSPQAGLQKWFFVIIKLLLSVAEVGGFLGMILGVSLMDLEMLFKKILLLVKSKRFSDNIWLISHLNNIIYAPSYTITTVIELLRCLEQTNFVKILLNLNISQVRSETGWEPKLAKYNCTFCVEI